MVPLTGFEPSSSFREADFESIAYASSTTPAPYMQPVEYAGPKLQMKKLRRRE